MVKRAQNRLYVGLGCQGRSKIRGQPTTAYMLALAAKAVLRPVPVATWGEGGDQYHTRQPNKTDRGVGLA